MSSKLSQVLHIEPPSELTFKGPFTDVVTTAMVLKNPSSKSVCFKVKTTAPKQYCVRPNSGIIPANGSVNVSVMLQPFDSATDSLERGKHKFMVQSVFVPEGEHSLENIWKNTPASEFMESKLRVVLDNPEMNDSEKLIHPKPSPQTQSSAVQESDVRRLVDENKRLQHRLQQEESENAKLKDRLRELESNRLPQSSFTGGGVSSKTQLVSQNVKLMHLVMAVFVALFIGILFGRLIR